MGFKTGLLVGFGVGYVLGTKAGRERYEELRATWSQISGNPTVQKTVQKGREVAQAGTERGLRAVQEGVDKATGSVKDRLQGGQTGTS